MKFSEPVIRLWPAETGNQLPFCHFRGIKPSCKNSAALFVGSALQEEPVGGACLPRIAKIALSARSFVAKLTGMNPFTFLQQSDLQRFLPVLD